MIIKVIRATDTSISCAIQTTSQYDFRANDIRPNFLSTLKFIEPRHEKIGIFACAKTKEQINFAVTAKLISDIVFVTRILQFLFFLNPNFLAYSHLLCLYSSVSVGPVLKPHCLFSHDAAQI